MQRIKCIFASIAMTSIIASLCYAQGGYQCADCHSDGQVIRNCLASGCHDAYNKGNHHTTGVAFAGLCAACHESVDNHDERNPFPYPATELTPTVESCTTCHQGNEDPVDENGDPYPYAIYETEILEHMGFTPGFYASNCVLCHGNEFPTDPVDTADPNAFRNCETCHSMASLHSIPGHFKKGLWYDENGGLTEITAQERCEGCHLGEPAMSYVPEDMGTYDTKYSELDDAYCRDCHGENLSDQHHQTCPDPPAPPVIMDACEGMAPIVGARNVQVTLRGYDFGERKCDGYKVQMKDPTDGGNWIKLPVIEWTDNLIKCSLPPYLFSPYRRYKVRVKTPAGVSENRKFYVLPAPMVSHIEDNTGKDAQGPAGGWLTVYSRLDESQPSGKQGTFSGAREKRYEDPLDGTCPDFFGTIYVVAFNSSGGQYCAKTYDKWNASGNKDSFEVKLESLWRDDDGDYYKDSTEPKYGPQADRPDITLGTYSVQVCLIIYTDTNGNGSFSGDKDTIYQVVKSKSHIVYEINTDPLISKLGPKVLEPTDTLKIKGYDFGTSQGSSIVHIGANTLDSTSPGMRLWSADRIKITVPEYQCEDFGGNTSVTEKVWVTVGGVNSNKEKLTINRPGPCL